MNQEYFEKMGQFYKKLQKPMQDFAELNLQAVEEFKKVDFEEFFNAKKPEEVIELQIKAAVENGKKTLEYMQKSFDIFQKSALEVSKELKTKAKK